MTEDEISEFIERSIEQVKSGLPNGCELTGNFDFEISLQTIKSKEGKIGIHLAGIGGISETQQVHKLYFSIVDKKSRQKNVKYVQKVMQNMLSDIAKLDQIDK